MNKKWMNDFTNVNKQTRFISLMFDFNMQNTAKKIARLTMNLNAQGSNPWCQFWFRNLDAFTFFAVRWNPCK